MTAQSSGIVQLDRRTQTNAIWTTVIETLQGFELESYHHHALTISGLSIPNELSYPTHQSTPRTCAALTRRVTRSFTRSIRSTPSCTAFCTLWRPVLSKKHTSPRTRTNATALNMLVLCAAINRHCRCNQISERNIAGESIRPSHGELSRFPRRRGVTRSAAKRTSKMASRDVVRRD